MYTGHLGLALGAKGLEPKLSLWLLCTATLAPDIIDFAAREFSVDTSVWTHTLPGMAGAGILFFALGWVLTRRVFASAVAGLVASSHFLADLLTSRLQLWPGGPTVGLHWYQRHTFDFCVEATVVFLGWLLYCRSLPANQRFSVASVAIVVILLSLQGVHGDT